MTIDCHSYLTFNLNLWESNEYLNYCFCLQTSKMKVVAMPEVYFYDLSLRKAMDAARFFSLVDLSSFSSTCD